MQEDFFIHFERSGGFTGITIEVDIDSKELSKEEREKFIKLIDSSGFLEYNHKDSVTNQVPDQFQYYITFEKEGYKRSVELNESTIPENLVPLIRYLTQFARSQKKN